MEITIKPAEKIEGQTRVPGDAAIAQRALLFSSLTEDNVEIVGFPETDDTMAALRCLKELGGEFTRSNGNIKVRGKGLRGFTEPENVLDAGNSQTTAQLLAGLLAGQPFCATLTGNSSLKSQSMKSVTGLLMQMGASIDGRHHGDLLPLTIRGYDLLPINYTMPAANAELKSAILTAALYSRGVSELTDPYQSGDHTERALRYLGAGISRLDNCLIGLEGAIRLKGERFIIPGDISKAAYLIVAAALAMRGELYLQDVGINPSRTAFLQVLELMGVRIQKTNEREENCEPVADLLVTGGRSLKGTEISEATLQQLSDELPAIIVAALFARGDSLIRGVGKLAPEKLSRLHSLSRELRRMGAQLEETGNGLIVRGDAKLDGIQVASQSDPAVTMALAVAALFAGSPSVIRGAEAVQLLYPGYFDAMNKLAS